MSINCIRAIVESAAKSHPDKKAVVDLSMDSEAKRSSHIFSGRRDQAEPIIQKAPSQRNDQFHAEQRRLSEEGYGTIPAIAVDAGEELSTQQRYVVEAFKDVAHKSGAISIFGKRQPYQSEAYQTSAQYRDAYLNSAEPGRAFDAAQAGPEVTVLERIGYSSMQTEQGQSVTLKVKGQAGAPCSFTSFDGGHFKNGLSYTTLQFDASGVCAAEFTPTRGVIHQCRLRAGSPEHSGTIQWHVFVRLPEEEKQN